MNYIKHLTTFFDKVIEDNTLNATHISIYMALFQCWNCNRFRNPISISRDEIMQISKVSSKATYHKCLKNLHNAGYIKYEPSFNPFRGSHVVVFDLSEVILPTPARVTRLKNELLSEAVSKQVGNNKRASTKTAKRQALVSSINKTNKTNSTNKTNKLAQAKIEKNKIENKIENKKENKEENKMETTNPYNAPTMEEVKKYFQEQKFPELEAQKFHNYFAAIGWRIGGKIPILNWQATAQNWILNSNIFNQTHQSNTNQPNTPNPKNPIRPQQLTTPTNKNYDEPL